MEEEVDDSDDDSDYEAEPVPSTSTRPSRPQKRQGRMPSAQRRKRPKASRPPRQERSWRQTDLTNRQKDRFVWETQPTDTSKLPQDPTELFDLFFDREIIELIVNQSISYAASKGNHSFTVTCKEIYAYLGILLLSGYTEVPRTRLYWSHDKDVHNQAVSEAMARDRFEEITRYLHLADNTQLDPNDRMAKVRPLLSMMNERCLNFFQKEQNLSIDESMVPYYGRHGAKQFIRGKPIRFGYKFWVLTTPLGYAVQFEPYQGAKGRQAPECPGLGMGGAVVVDLISEIQRDEKDLHFHLTFDNLFTSLRLVDYLTSKGIGCTGTIRSNRLEDCPLKSINELKKTPRGTYDYATDTTSGVVVVRWNDNNIVNVVSNKVGLHPLQTAGRWSRSEKKKVQIAQPFIVKHYNKTMGGVDRMDQNISTYRVGIRSKKWWWPIFVYCIDLAVQQAWLLYRKTPAYSESPLDLLAVRRAVAVKYLSQAPRQAVPARSLGRCPKLDKRVPRSIRLDGKDHLIEAIGKQLRCAHCHGKSRQQCRKCKVPVHLKCFGAFHTA